MSTSHVGGFQRQKSSLCCLWKYTTRFIPDPRTITSLVMANPIPTAQEMIDRGISVAQLSIISLARLHQKDPAELALLNAAASKVGFFYLDFRGGNTESDRLLAHLPSVYTLAEKYFSQPEAAKAKDVRLDIKPTQDLGWKNGIDRESYEVRPTNTLKNTHFITHTVNQISRDELALDGASIPPFPQPFKDEWEKIAEFSAGCDGACLTLLNSLSADFMEYHRIDQPSDTGLKLVVHQSSAKVSDVGENLHTDSGTLTLLFFKDWSVHGFLPDIQDWAFTPPPPEGCALVNIADVLQRLSGGELHSPKHRVTQPFDGAKNRYYLSYFLRPEDALIG